MKTISSKTAIVTGAGHPKGIGRAICRQLALAGVNIAALDLTAAVGLDTVVQDLESLGVKACSIECDVTSPMSISNALEQVRRSLGPVDLLVNNAGNNRPEHFTKVKKENMEYLVELNMKAAFNVAQLCAQKMVQLKNRKKIGGSIINMSSQLGRVGAPIRSVYNMTKFGLEGLTRGMALELSKSNIRVNSVCPNIVLTPRTKKYFSDKKYNKYVKESTPINKVVTISDVATSITFLASEASSMITGTSIIIDGGWTAK